MGDGAERGTFTERCELWHKRLADQRLDLPLPSAELLLGTICPSKDYLSQHPLQLGGVTLLVLTNWMWTEVMYKVGKKQLCLLHPLFSPSANRRKASEAQEEGRAMRQKVPAALSDFMECCPFINTKFMKNEQEISEWNHWDFRDSMLQLLMLPD